MHDQIIHEITAQYCQTPPRMRMAQDGPASDFVNRLRTLGRRWQRSFDESAVQLAKWFSDATFKQADAVFKKHLADIGWTVKFTNSPVVQDVLKATMAEQVSLIKSIGQQHLSEVEGLVLRSVQQGGDLGTLTQQLHDRYDITKKRAALIAKTQNQFATSSITRVRQQEVGIQRAVWRHSRAGKEPRPEHVAFDGQTYDVKTGAFLEGKWTWPGREINCRCVAIAVIPGLD